MVRGGDTDTRGILRVNLIELNVADQIWADMRKFLNKSSKLMRTFLEKFFRMK